MLRRDAAMKAMVVYDSVFGNTEQVAQTIARTLSESPEMEAAVEAQRATAVDPQTLMGVGVLVVGSPTRAFQPTPDMKNWLKAIPNGRLDGVRVAAFDTRINVEEKGPWILKLLVKFFGYAAKPIASRLESKGGRLVVPPEGFHVDESEGPLTEGELERVAAWARRIVAAS
jgi:flavodoxin